MRWVVTIDFVSGPSYTCDVEAQSERMARIMAQAAARGGGHDGTIRGMVLVRDDDEDEGETT